MLDREGSEEDWKVVEVLKFARFTTNNEVQADYYVSGCAGILRLLLSMFALRPKGTIAVGSHCALKTQCSSLDSENWWKKIDHGKARGPLGTLSARLWRSRTDGKAEDKPQGRRKSLIRQLDARWENQLYCSN